MTAETTTGLRSVPPELNTDQKDQLLRLWTIHARELVDVQPSNEVLGKSAIRRVPEPAFSFVVRLRHFLGTLLSENSCLVGNTEIGRSRWVKDLSQTCLAPFLKLALSGTSDRCTSPKTRSPRLFAPGRRVIAIHHEDFLSELNHFECQGQTPTDDFVRRESLGAFLYHMPHDGLRVVGCAMALAIVNAYAQQEKQQQQQSTTDEHCTSYATEVDRFIGSTQIHVRFVHVQPTVQMMDIKTGLVGKLLTVQGHVVKARPKRLRIATADFACGKCGVLVTHAFTAGRYSLPTRCSGTSCTSRTFSLVRPTTRYTNVQELRLQEAQEESISHAGRTPRQLVVECVQDLVDVCRPGDLVMLAATVAAVNTAVAAGKTGKRAQETSTYQLFLQAHSITTLSERGSRSQTSKTTAQVVYTSQQLQAITQLCHADHRYFGLPERRAFPFDLLVRSLCPSIIGHDEVKAGLLLCLLGGTPPSSSGGGMDKGHSIRSNSHILIVGDPGMGKSQMLLAACQLAARSVYVGGNTSSTTGLTVTLTKEEGGESGIEAGALVLADQGVCCIDEFDKMAKNHQDGLLEAMEQQQVSIAKAGVVASLPARCSLIAAANPKHGSYNMNKTVAENLNMAKPILSRFDLVYILRDRANKEQDRMVSSNIMNLYRNGSNNNPLMHSDIDLSQRVMTAGNGKGEGTQRIPLSERLAWVTGFQKDPLPADLVRDYIAYAREYCKPKMTAEAATVLKDFFMDLRYPADGGRRPRDTVPITTRQLEALIRLCQARAKACLRDFVLKEDALDVVELMSKSVEQVHRDESGVLDPIRGGAGGKSNKKMKKAFVQEMQRLIGAGAECSLDDLRRIADKVNCGLSEFQPLVEDLRSNGIILRKSNGNYQIL